MVIGIAAGGQIR